MCRLGLHIIYQRRDPQAVILIYVKHSLMLPFITFIESTHGAFYKHQVLASQRRTQYANRSNGMLLLRDFKGMFCNVTET